MPLCRSLLPPTFQSAPRLGRLWRDPSPFQLPLQSGDLLLQIFYIVLLALIGLLGLAGLRLGVLGLHLSDPQLYGADLAPSLGISAASTVNS